jgi:uracil-DNA glycosylase
MSLNESQQRAWQALQIGPIWTDDSLVLAAPIGAAPAFSPVLQPAVQSETQPALRADLQPAQDSVHLVAGTVAIFQAALTKLDWPQLTEAANACEQCGLCQSRKQAVFGSGQPQMDGAGWMIVGEAPGDLEDQSGQPFQGPAGQLLDQMLKAVGLNRNTDCVITNAVKCMPPNDRSPSVSEVNHCKPYLLAQIELVQPKVLLLLGRVAAKAVLGQDQSIAQWRGADAANERSGQYQYELKDGTAIAVVVSYHPSYLVREPTEKAKSWSDLLKLKRLASA